MAPAPGRPTQAQRNHLHTANPAVPGQVGPLQAAIKLRIRRRAGPAQTAKAGPNGTALARPGAAFGNPKRRVQAQFSYGQDEYRLWVTDPAAEERYLAADDGVHQAGPSYLTVSVGEPYGDSCYKLVAAVIGGES